MEASKFKSQPILFAISLCLFAGMLFVSMKNQSLSKKYEALLSASKKVEASVADLETKNKQLSEELSKAAGSNTDMQTMKEQYDAEIARIKKENENILFEIKKSEQAMQSAIDEKRYLEDILISKTREIESLKNQNPSASGPSTTDKDAEIKRLSDENKSLLARLNTAASGTTATLAPAQLSSEIAKKDEEIRKLSDQNKVLSDKLARLYQLTTSKITEINVAKIALEESLSGTKKSIDDEMSTVNLGTITVDKTAQKSEKSEPARMGPKTEGKILAINETHGFVVVDLGKVDNVPSSADLVVVHEGKNIATLSVLEVRDVMTACNIKQLADGAKIQVNDPVRIQR